MAKQKPLQEKTPKGNPITFRDISFVNRTITLKLETGKRTLKIVNSLVTVQASDVIDALDNMFGMEREKK